MTNGSEMLALARTRIGEKYVNVCVPKNNSNWHGPWDCAEFMSWLVYQVGGFLYGCFDDHGNPATVGKEAINFRAGPVAELVGARFRPQR